MSAVPSDRKEWALGSFIATQESGPDYVRDALSDEVVRGIGQLIQCGDVAEIGPYLLRELGKYQAMMIAIGEAKEAEEEQDQRDMFESANSEEEGNMFPSWDRFTNYDRETGISCSGEI